MNLKVFVLLLGNHEQRYSEKSSTKYTYELIAFDPGNVLGHGVFESPIFNFFPWGACPLIPYIIRALGLKASLFLQ